MTAIERFSLRDKIAIVTGANLVVDGGRTAV